MCEDTRRRWKFTAEKLNRFVGFSQTTRPALPVVSFITFLMLMRGRCLIKKRKVSYKYLYISKRKWWIRDATSHQIKRERRSTFSMKQSGLDRAALIDDADTTLRAPRHRSGPLPWGLPANQWPHSQAELRLNINIPSSTACIDPHAHPATDPVGSEENGRTRTDRKEAHDTKQKQKGAGIIIMIVYVLYCLSRAFWDL